MTNINMLPDGYPEKVEFSDQYSIFSVAMKHKIDENIFNDAKLSKGTFEALNA